MKVILKNYIFVSSIVLIVVFILSLLGIVPNLQYNRGGVIRNSFGFIYPTDFASHCFYLFIAYSYLLKDRLIWTRTIVGILLAGFVIKYCDARLNALSILLATVIFIYFYVVGEKKLRIYAILPYSVLIFSSLMMYLSYTFSWSSPFLVSINKLITGRLALGRNAFTSFSVNLFGTREVLFIGSGGKTEAVMGYNYVDSSYVQMLFTYGIVPVVLLIIIYIISAKEQSKRSIFICSNSIYNCSKLHDWSILVCALVQYFYVYVVFKNTFDRIKLNDSFRKLTLKFLISREIVLNDIIFLICQFW